MSFILSGRQDESWHVLWTFDAFWHLLYTGVLLTICVLWSPSRNNLQYAYLDEIAAQDVEEEAEGGDNDQDSTSADGSTSGSTAPYKVSTA